jgi:hypothetical protein
MTAIHILKLPRVTATVKVFKTDDLIELSCRCHHTGSCREWSDLDAAELWWWSVVDLYQDDSRRIETRWEDVDTYAKLFVSPFHVLWHISYVSR